MHKEFPGLPLALHEDTIVAVVKGAYKVPEDTVYRVFVTNTSAMIQAVEDDTNTHYLWENRSNKKYM